jgi:hypothetical protein
MLDARLSYCFFCLRLACGVLPIVSGLEKFNAGGPWARAEGVVLLVTGLLVFTVFSEVAAYFLAACFLLFAVQTARTHGADSLAVSDVVVAVAAFVFARLTRVNQGAQQPLRVVAARPAAVPETHHSDASVSLNP